MEPNLSEDTIRDIYSRLSDKPNYCDTKIHVDSHLNLDTWRHYEPIIARKDRTLVDQLDFGFHMGIDYSYPFAIPVTNHLSARQNYETIDQFIIKHYEDGALIGPYRTNPFPVYARPSPMQVVTSASGKVRPVLDMSYPRSASINDSIPRTWTDIQGFEGEFKLPTHEDVCREILRTENPVMFITDLKSFYMQIPSDWKDTPFMCLTWRGAIFFHRRLPFGCRSSCLQAQRVTDAVVLIFTTEHNVHLAGYVDDFTSILRKLRSASLYAIFHKLLDDLGLWKTLEKCQSPDVIRIFLGLLYNLLDLTLTLPDEKLDRAVAFLEKWINKHQCSKHDIQVLLGHLNHIASVLHAGKPFTAFIVDLLRADQFPAIVDDNLKQDLAMWLTFLRSDFRKTSIIKAFDLVEVDAVLRVAVRGQTCVIVFQGEIKAYKLHLDVPHMPPHLMYLIAVWLATDNYHEQCRDMVIRIAVPSKNAALAINRARVTSDYLRPMVRRMWLCQAYNDFLIRADVRKTNNCNELYSVFHEFAEVKLPLDY